VYNQHFNSDTKCVLAPNKFVKPVAVMGHFQVTGRPVLCGLSASRYTTIIVEYFKNKKGFIVENLIKVAHVFTNTIREKEQNEIKNYANDNSINLVFIE